MIRNLQAKDYKGFTGGKNTYVSLAETPLEAALDAKNVTVSADGAIKKRPGYTLVQNPLGTAVSRIFDFHRQTDRTQHLYLAGAGKIATMDPAGVAAAAVLSAAEDATAQWDFAPQLWGCYLSNGLQAYRQVHNGGAEKLYDWGLAAPTVAPALSTSPGSLTLQYGRQYAYCPVSYITGADAVERMSIGAPSPASAHTGPVTDVVVVVESIPVATDPQQTHWWIFATVDSPFGSSGTYFFAAEIANGTTSWGDALSDDQLDSTRQAPFDNYPAPAAEILIEYQSRIAALRIAGRPDMVRLSGYEEIDLGLPEEAWPPDLFFTVPGGTQAITAAIAFADQLMIATKDFWWSVSGYDASTFVKRDRIASPGCAGKRLVVATPTHMAWVSPDKKLWAWDASSAPFELSLYQRTPLVGTLSMQDLNGATLADARLIYFNAGELHWILLLANTAGVSGGFDWLAIWDLDSQGTPQTSDVVQAGRAAQFDMLPAHKMTAAAVVEVADKPWLFLSDTAGNIYRFPDGYTDAGEIVHASYHTLWHHLGLRSQFYNEGPSALMKRLFWLDLATDRQDAAKQFRALAAAGDGLDMSAPLTDLPLSQVPPPGGGDTTVARATFTPLVPLARWVRFGFEFPLDDQPAAISQYSVAFAPLWSAAP